MKVDRPRVFQSFEGEDGSALRVGYENQGEPYREGVCLNLYNAGFRHEVYVFLEDREGKQLRDLLLRLYPLENSK